MKSFGQWLRTLFTWGDFSFASSGPGTEKPGVQSPMVFIEGPGEFEFRLERGSVHDDTLERILGRHLSHRVHAIARYEGAGTQARIAVRTLEHGELLGYVPRDLDGAVVAVIHSALSRRGTELPLREWTARLWADVHPATTDESQLTAWLDLPLERQGDAPRDAA